MANKEGFSKKRWLEQRIYDPDLINTRLKDGAVYTAKEVEELLYPQKKEAMPRKEAE